MPLHLRPYLHVQLLKKLAQTALFVVHVAQGSQGNLEAASGGLGRASAPSSAVAVAIGHGQHIDFLRLGSETTWRVAGCALRETLGIGVWAPALDTSNALTPLVLDLYDPLIMPST